MKSATIVIFIAAALGLAQVPPIDAQQLRALKEIHILGAVSDGVESCGISREQLQTAATFVTRQSRLAITTNPRTPGTLRIQATRVAGTNPEWCVVHVEVTFSATIEGTTDYEPVHDSVTPFRQGSVFWGDPTEVQKQATDFVQVATKSFAMQWAKNNP